MSDMIMKQPDGGYHVADASNLTKKDWHNSFLITAKLQSKKIKRKISSNFCGFFITVAAHLKTAVINPNSYFFQDNLLCKLRHKSNIYRPFSFIAALKYAGLIYHFLT